MPRSSRFSRAVLIAGALTTIATSSVSDPQLTDRKTTQLLSRSPVHVTVIADTAVTAEAETLLITANIRGGTNADIRFVPDDPTLPPRTLAFAGGERELSWVFLAGEPPDPSQDQFACPRDAPCELGFTVEVLADEPSLRELAIEVSATSQADQSLCMPDDATFAETATVEIRFDVP